LKTTSYVKNQKINTYMATLILKVEGKMALAVMLLVIAMRQGSTHCA